MVLMETWIEEKGWERVRGRLPREYKWGIQWATKKDKRGRAIEEMLMRIIKKYRRRGKRLIQRWRE